MKKNSIKTGLVMIFIIGIIFMLVSTTLVYMLPEDIMKKHIAGDIDQLVEEKEWPEYVQGYLCTRKDNFTDALMLNMATQQQDKQDLAIKRAMRSNLPTYIPEYTQTVSLKKQIENKEKGDHTLYYRYWHGYQIFLKLLLMVLTYSQIIHLNGVVLLFLFLLILIKMRKKGIEVKYIISFVFSILLLVPSVIVMNIQYTTMFYIQFISILALLKCEKRNIFYIFFITGMATSFFDLLTTPILSLGIPLLFMGLINLELKGIKYLINIIQNTLLWAAGYGLTWMSKWLIASIILRENVFANAIEKIFLRTSSNITDGSNIAYLDILQKLSSVYGKKLGLIILLVMLALLLLGCISGLVKRNINIIPLLLIAVMPFVWFYVLKNHSYIHLWFTFRNLEITYLGIFMIFIQGFWTRRTI
ncbi:hypothetical protein [Anaerostipes sp.]|uniref:hypothetical protein n=1 Tax=Anaerostipes sp. TaxID=1872530 RepID=UPI0025BA2B50|nr:hypothetical protein [Anaerostipes sp.]MBS7007132.1 hypothetical protein [Anaerostipes sp.]